MKLRPATSADAPALTNLINRAFEVERFFIPGDRISLPGVEAYMDKGCFLLAENEEGIYASIYFEIRGERGYFGLLSVLPSLQGKGYGSALISEVEKYLCNAQCRYLDIQIVNIRPELLPFYLKHGFRETGVAPFEKADISKLPCHFINMSKALYPAGHHASV